MFAEENLMNRWTISNGTIVTYDRLIEGGTVVIQGGKILYAGTPAGVPTGRSERTIDAGRRLICPGLIEMHTNGALGHDFLDANEAELEEIAVFQARHGTTGFLTTLCTSSQAQTVKAARIIRNLTERKHRGAEILGIHMEGPYFNPKFRRVHPIEHIREYTRHELDEMIAASGNLIRLFTLAPEMPGALEFIPYLRQKGIVAAMGHCDASYDQAIQGIDAGITYSTHTFAAMREFHHRDPGASGASLIDDRITAEILSDGLHLHPETVKLALKAKGSARVVIATDAMAGAGLPDGDYLLAGQKVSVKEGRTVSPEGRIAGGIGTMDLAVRNMHEWTHLSIPETVRMASFNPAKIMGFDDRKGSIAIGKDADLFICDLEFNPWLTVVAGQIEFQAR
jgi:N-acetylglucosamine-6-phosphate deacetylase